MTQSQGLIFDIRKFSIHDGPGIRTTVFFKGCPLACWWCHNPESQSAAQEMMLWQSRCIRCGSCAPACPQSAISAVDAPVGMAATAVDYGSAVKGAPAPETVAVRYQTNREICIVCEKCMAACAADARELVGKRMTIAEVMREIERDQAFFEDSGGGVTFSGGEPLSQRAFLLELLKGCKALDLHTAVDTSGYAPWKAIESIRPFTDLFLYDLKVMDDARHREYTGVPNGLILHNLQALAEHGSRIIIRVPIIPGLNDDQQNIEQVGQFVRNLPNIERVDILPYHPSAEGKYERLGKEYHLPDTQTPSDEHMQEIAAWLEKYHLSVKIGG